jgi:DNA-binding MarR family transcriptional regulator
LVDEILSRSGIQDIYRISFLANHLVGPVYAGIERDHGLTRPEFLVLFVLSRKDGLTASEIVALSGLPKNSISRGLTLAEDKGLLRRARDPNDRRRAFLHVLPKGRALCSSLVSRFTEREAQLLAPLTPGERSRLSGLLKKLVSGSDDWAQPV